MLIEFKISYSLPVTESSTLAKVFTTWLEKAVSKIQVARRHLHSLWNLDRVWKINALPSLPSPHLSVSLSFSLSYTHTHTISLSHYSPTLTNTSYCYTHWFRETHTFNFPPPLLPPSRYPPLSLPISLPLSFPIRQSYRCTCPSWAGSFAA